VVSSPTFGVVLYVHRELCSHLILDCTAKALSHQMAALRKDCKKYWQGKDGVPYPTVAGTTIGPATPNSRKRNTPAKQENDGDDGASSEIDTPTKKKSKAGKKLSSKATEVGGIEHAGGSGDAEVKDEIEV